MVHAFFFSPFIMIPLIRRATCITGDRLPSLTVIVSLAARLVVEGSFGPMGEPEGEWEDIYTNQIKNKAEAANCNQDTISSQTLGIARFKSRALVGIVIIWTKRELDVRRSC